MIDSLAGVTIVTPDLDAAMIAYRDWLGYRAGPIAPVGADRATAWCTPAAATARMAELRPESGEARFIRLIEGVPDPGFRPMTSYGWAAAELIVQDVDRLAERLGVPDSPFRIIGHPAVLDLGFTDKIKAMQVVGPGGEVLYLTAVSDVIPGFDLPVAASFVGQVFIMVLAAPDIAQGAEVYARHGRPAGPELQARIEILSEAHGLPADHRHRLATIALGAESLIEIDAFPAGTGARPIASIGLASGIAMASFYGSSERAAPGLVIGNAGEAIEILAWAGVGVAHKF